MITRVPPLTVVGAIALTLPFMPPAVLAQAFDSIWNVGSALMGITFLIVIHEAGHFAAARYYGVRCEVFSVGFGPRLFGKKWGDTDYRISAIPVGGYVAMAGESPEDEPTGAEDEFCSKGVGPRSVILAAGVIMNIILALVLFIVAFMVGVRFVVPTVGGVSKGGPADGKLQRGDRIVAIDGSEIVDFYDVHVAAALSDAEDGIEVEILRPGETETRKFQLKARRGKTDNFPTLDVGPMEVVADVDPESAGAKAAVYAEKAVTPARAASGGLLGLALPRAERGVRTNDRIIATDGALTDVFRGLRESPGAPVAIMIERPLTVRPAGDGPTEVEHERLRVVVTPVARQIKTIGLKLAGMPRVSAVIPGTAADEAGLKANDVIELIGGEPASYETLRELVKATGGKPTPFVVRRRTGEGDEETETAVTVSVTPKEVAAGYQLGVEYDAPIVESVEADSPAAAAGLQAGDRLVSLSIGRYLGIFQKWKPVGNDSTLPDLLRATDGEFALLYVRDGKQAQTSVSGAVDHATEAFGEHGILIKEDRFTMRVGPLRACGLGFGRTILMTKRIGMMIRGLVAQRVSPKELGGPVQIVYVSYKLAQRGIGTLIYFLALLSVNLAVINVLPIPALDGGHLLFLLVEKLRGSPAPANVMTIAQLVGVALLLLLMLYVFANDIMRFRG